MTQSRRFFLAAAAGFLAAGVADAPAEAHGRRGRAHHGGRRRAAPHHRRGETHDPAATASADIAPQSVATAEPASADPRLQRLDPHSQIRKPLLVAALAALDAHKDRITDPSKLFIADFAQHSSKPRLYMVDMTSGEVKAFRTAHGRGSDPDRSGWARKFSNNPGSFASSLGAYVTLGKGFGLAHGTHVGLDGLDPSNNLAKDRAIIVHSAEYCELPFLRSFGMLGRSEGCFATSSKEFRQLMPAMGEGRLLYAGV